MDVHSLAGSPPARPSQISGKETLGGEDLEGTVLTMQSALSLQPDASQRSRSVIKQASSSSSRQEAAEKQVPAWTRWFNLERYLWGFHRLLRSRMVSYGLRSPHPISQLTSAVDKVMETVNLRGGGLTAFSKPLGKLLQDPVILKFLTGLESGLEAAQGGTFFNVWEYTLKAAGSRERAITWLAILLQDTSVRVAKPEYGFLKPYPDSPQKRALQRCLRIFTSDRKVYSHLRLYPKSVETDRQPLYHYYVPAYLALKAKENGFAPKVCMLAATIFNAEYEFAQAIHTDQDPKTISSWFLALARIAWGPRSKMVLSDGTLHDVYLGLAGASQVFADGMPLLSIQEVKEGLTNARPIRFLRRLFGM